MYNRILINIYITNAYVYLLNWIVHKYYKYILLFNNNIPTAYNNCKTIH